MWNGFNNNMSSCSIRWIPHFYMLETALSDDQPTALLCRYLQTAIIECCSWGRERRYSMRDNSIHSTHRSVIGWLINYLIFLRIYITSPSEQHQIVLIVLRGHCDKLLQFSPVIQCRLCFSDRIHVVSHWHCRMFCWPTNLTALSSSMQTMFCD
jgi:hypothetical protein